MLTLIRGGRVVDPGTVDAVMDILISDGKIVAIQKPRGNSHPDKPGDVYKAPDGKDRVVDHVIDATDKIVTPGLIDMHVHLREPGYEYKETIETGSRAAAAGGFTAICALPNTNPVNDNRQVTEYILKKSKNLEIVNVYPIAGLSRGLNGTALNEYGELKYSGAIALSDNKPVTDSQFMRRALEYAKGFGLLVIAHCEDPDLSAGGVMNEGGVATRMGLAGIPNAAESVVALRDIALSEVTGSPLHIAHVSTEETVAAIRDAKKKGLKVTAATAPQYFSLTEDAVKHYDTRAKMNPPLRSYQDMQAVCQGLADGTIDVIASDHTPQSSVEKEIEFDLASDGIVGLETSLSLSLKLVDQGVLTLDSLVTKMSINPAKILGLESGIKIGSEADLTIIDLKKSFRVVPNQFQSLGRYTPFENWQLTGRAVLTMVKGKVVFNEAL